MFKKYILPVLFISLSVGALVYFQFSILSILCGFSLAVLVAKLFNFKRTSTSTNTKLDKKPTHKSEEDKPNQDKLNTQPQKTFTTAFQMKQTAEADISTKDLCSNKGIYKAVCQVIAHQLPEKIQHGLRSMPITMSVLALAVLKKSFDNIAHIPVYGFKADYQRQNEIHISKIVFDLNNENYHSLFKKQLESIQKLPSKQRPPRIIIPIGCSTGVPHVVTGVIDFDKNGNVSCLIYDPMGSAGYRNPKDIFIDTIKQSFKLKHLKVIEPNVRVQKYDMTKCAIWCFTFQEYLCNQAISTPLEQFGFPFEWFVKAKYAIYCKEKGCTVSADPKIAEVQFTNMQYEYMKTLLSELKTELEKKLSISAAKKRHRV